MVASLMQEVPDWRKAYTPYYVLVSLGMVGLSRGCAQRSLTLRTGEWARA